MTFNHKNRFGLAGINWWKRFYLVFFLGTISFLARAQTVEPVKLALVAPSRDTAQILDLLTVQFSTNPQLHLLERSEISRVYQEHELAAANSNFVQLGHLLSADGLLLIEPAQIDGQPLLQLRLVAANTGVIIREERLAPPGRDLSGWAADIAARFTPLLQKLSVPATAAIPISILNLRSTFQTVETRLLEENLTLLAGEALSKQPRVFVLERKRMESLSQENELSGSATNTFWTGGYLLDGVLDRDGYQSNQVTLNARLTPPGGKPPVQINVTTDRTNVAGLAEQLTEKILHELPITMNGSVWNRSEEAHQYLDETKWALRWGLHEEARAASESAWALGDRSRDLVMARIRAYDGLAQPSLDEPNPAVPMVANPNQLAPAERALNLYHADATIIVTNTTNYDSEWFDLGTKTLLRAAVILQSFYQTSGLVRENKDAIASLRESARRALSIAKIQSELVFRYKKQFLPGRTNPKGLFYDSKTFKVAETFDSLSWNYGGVFFDKPEDSLPLFHETLQRISEPSHLPDISGWSWDDRKRIPKILTRFLNETVAGTNAQTHLKGAFLLFLRSLKEGEVETAMQNFTSEIWRYRDEVYTDGALCLLFEALERQLGSKYYQVYESNRNPEPLASFKQRLRLDYLASTNSDKSNPEIFRRLVPNQNGSYSANEAAALVAPLQQLNKAEPDFWYARSALAVVTQAAGSNVKPVPSPQDATRKSIPSIAASPIATLQFRPWTIALPTNGYRPVTSQLIFRNDRVWAAVDYQMGSGVIYGDLKPRSRLFDVNQTTGDCEEVSLPEGVEDIGQHFDVGSNAVYLSTPSKLLWRKLGAQSWNTLPVPTDQKGTVLAQNGWVFLNAGGQLLEMEPEKQTIEVLGSARRNPPVNEIDRNMISGPKNLFSAGQNSIGFYAGTNVFFLNLLDHHWTQTSSSVKSILDLTLWFPSQNSLQILYSVLSQAWEHHTVVSFSAYSAQPELLLEQIYTGFNAPIQSEKKNGKARWNWPNDMRLGYASLELRDQVLWSFEPRHLQWMMGPAEEQTVHFNDARQATLYRFSPGHSNPDQFALGFKKGNLEVDPFSSHAFRIIQQGSLLKPRPVLWLVTKDAIVIADIDRNPGHWFISQKELDQVAAASATPPTKGTAP